MKVTELKKVNMMLDKFLSCLLVSWKIIYRHLALLLFNPI